MKYFLLLSITLLLSLQLYSQSQGPYNPSAGTSVSAANGKPWTNTTNILASDNVYSTCILGYYPTCSGTSCYATTGLAATGFGFSIPLGSVISGIAVEAERRTQGATVNQVYDSTFMLMKNNIPTGADRSSAVAWSNAGAGSYTTYGSSSDLWGTTWTISDINDANFGVYLIARNTATANAPQVGVDHIRVTVYYTSATGIKTSQSTHAFSVYPNPASSAVTIHADIRIQSIHVRNLMGEVVYTANPAQSRSLAIDLSSHPRGIYFVEIVDENQNSSVEKITLE